MSLREPESPTQGRSLQRKRQAEPKTLYNHTLSVLDVHLQTATQAGAPEARQGTFIICTCTCRLTRARAYNSRRVAHLYDRVCGLAVSLWLESLLGRQCQVKRDGIVGVTGYTVVEMVVLAIRH